MDKRSSPAKLLDAAAFALFHLGASVAISSIIDNNQTARCHVYLFNNATINIPVPVNEPQFSYAPGSPERVKLKAELARLKAQRIEIPLIIGGQEVRTGRTIEVVQPHDHGHVLAICHLAGEK